MNTVTRTKEELEIEYELVLMMIAEGIVDQNEGNFLLTALGSEYSKA